MILIINTSQSDQIEIILVKEPVNFKVKKIAGSRQQSEKLLVSINGLLKKNKIKTSQLKGIGVVSGPGGFTSLRIGIATANALAYGLDVPVVGVSAKDFADSRGLAAKIFKKMEKAVKGKIVVPVYDREPNITMKKIKKC
ncbi:MAG: tRNA (adenosine(37)-N6)-threonylcarbamoyltransferase complex dimerization subunit type 1 TsaB [Patescibacteria group bacterium]